MTDKKQLRKEWLEALRSGEYNQTKDNLQDKKGYCCLGVACDIAEKHGIFVSRSLESGDIVGFDLRDQKQTWGAFGFRSFEGRASSYKSPALVVMNDQGTPFSEIADIVEKNMDLYFED